MLVRDKVIFKGAVEGMVDEAVAGRLVSHVGAELGVVYGKHGKDFLRPRLVGYNWAARYGPWLIIVDLDDADCPPPLLESWLPNPAEYMCFRVAVREIESWLLADRERIAGFLSIAASRIPGNPEDLDDPKAALVNLARKSRRRAIREDMVPRPGSGAKTGPAYSSRLVEFSQDPQKGWRHDVASRSSESLHRCLQCLQKLVKEFK